MKNLRLKPFDLGKLKGKIKNLCTHLMSFVKNLQFVRNSVGNLYLSVGQLQLFILLTFSTQDAATPLVSHKSSYDSSHSCN